MRKTRVSFSKNLSQQSTIATLVNIDDLIMKSINMVKHYLLITLMILNQYLQKENFLTWGNFCDAEEGL